MSHANIALESWSLNLDALRVADIDECKSILDSVDRVEDRSFIWRGIVLREIERRELWKDDRDALYTSMNDWIHRAPGKSARDRYAALAAVEALKEIPLHELSQVPRCNVETLKKLSTGVQTEPETIAAAQTLSEDAFVEHVQARHPHQHLEKRVKPTLRLTEPVQAALDLVGKRMDIPDRQGQLECLCIDFTVEHQQ